jgi:hypothetical protein
MSLVPYNIKHRLPISNVSELEFSHHKKHLHCFLFSRTFSLTWQNDPFALTATQLVNIA